MASKAIRGITIEIGGDTSKLGKALEGTEKKTRSLQTELKQVEKLLKFDPTNTELLAQKQKILADMVEETSSKLDTLKTAQAQVTAQFERGEIGADQYRAFQREIIQTEKDLNSMKKELSSTETSLKNLSDGTDSAEKHTEEYKDKLEEANKTLKDFGDKAKEAGEKVGKGILAIGTATVAGAGYALKLSTDFDKAFNTLQTRTGATAEEMEDLNEAMENVYKNNFGESIEDVAESMAIVKVNTKASNDEIQGLTENALLLRDVFDFDVNESTRSAKMLMDQFGISGEQAYTLIAQGAQAGLDKNGDLLDTINEYAVHYEQLGYTSEEFFNSLVNGTASGTFSVDKLGDAMKEFGIRTKDTATTTTEGFELLGMDADLMRDKFAQGGESAREATEQTLEALFSMDDQVKQNQAGVDLFGTMWEDLGIEGVKALMDVSGEASITSDTLDKLNEQKYDDIGSALQGLGRTLETDVIDPLGDELKPVVEDAIEYVQENGPAITETVSGIASAIGDMIGWLVDNSDLVLATIVGIGTGLLVWNVASMINGVVTAIKAFQLANEGATIAQALFNAVLNANPIVLIVSLIAMLIAGIVTFIATNEDARAKFVEIWNKIKETAGVVLDAIVGFFSSAWETIKSVWSVVVEFFSGLWESIKEVFSTVGEFFSGIWATIVEIFSPAIEWFTALFTSIWNTLSSIITVIIGLIKGCWLIIQTVFGIAYSWFKTTVLDPVKNAFTVVWNTISNLASNAWNAIKSVFVPVATWFKSTVIDPVVNFFTGLWSKLTSGATGAWNGIKSVFSNVTTWFRDKFSEAWTAVKNVFSTGGKIFSGITEGITATFKTVVNGIIRGINKVVAIPFGAINGMLNKIRNSSFLGISPFSGLWKENPISVPTIPELAKGGILKRGQIGFLEGDGSEAVVPLEKNTEWTRNVARQMSDYQNQQNATTNTALLGKLDDIYMKLDKLKQAIVLDTGVLVGETINQIDSGLATNYAMRARGI